MKVYILANKDTMSSLGTVQEVLDLGHTVREQTQNCLRSCALDLQVCLLSAQPQETHWVLSKFLSS